MSSTTNVHNINETFQDGLRLIEQQKTARMRECVTVESVTGERQAIDLIGANRLLQKNERNVQTPVTETARYRRWMEQKDFWNSEIFDGFDKLRQKTDSTGRLAETWAAAAAREWDRCAIEAAVGTNMVGKFGEQAQPLPTSQIIAHGGTGFTRSKLEEAVFRLRRANPDTTDPIITFFTQYQERELLDDPKVSGGDYNESRPLMDSKLPYYGGSYFYNIEDHRDRESGTWDPILPYEGGATPVRRVIMTLKSGLVMGELKPITTEINPRKDMGQDTWQLSVEMSVGGTRGDDVKVVVIECVDNSPMDI